MKITEIDSYECEVKLKQMAEANGQVTIKEVIDAFVDKLDEDDVNSREELYEAVSAHVADATSRMLHPNQDATVHDDGRVEFETLIEPVTPLNSKQVEVLRHWINEGCCITWDEAEYEALDSIPFCLKESK